MSSPDDFPFEAQATRLARFWKPVLSTGNDFSEMFASTAWPLKPTASKPEPLVEFLELAESVYQGLSEEQIAEVESVALNTRPWRPIGGATDDVGE